MDPVLAEAFAKRLALYMEIAEVASEKLKEQQKRNSSFFNMVKLQSDLLIWVCPRCKKVNVPWVPSCNCNREKECEESN